MINIGKRPFFYLSVFFSLGIWLGSFFQKIPLIFFVILCAFVCLFFVSTLLLKKQKTGTILLIISFLFVGFLSYQKARLPSENDMSELNKISGSFHVAEGIISDFPAYDSQLRKYRFNCELKKVLFDEGWKDYPVKVLVNVFNSQEISDLKRGQMVSLKGRVKQPLGALNPFGFDMKKYLDIRRINLIFDVYNPKDLTILPVVKLSLFNRLSDFLRKRIKKTLLKGVDKKNKEVYILRAMILGERAGVPLDIKDSFIKTNTMHILAISGLHVGIIAGFLLVFCRLLFIPEKWRFGLTAIFLIIYVVISGGRPSVLRAVIMINCVLIGKMFNRKGDILNFMGFSALTILMVNPLSLFDPGFQLSYMTLLSILLIAPGIMAFYRDFMLPNLALIKMYSNTRILIVNTTGVLISVAFSAWIGSLPLVVYYFYIFSPVSFLLNIVAVIFLSCIVFIGFCSIFIGQLFSVFSIILNNFNIILIKGLLVFIQSVARIPFSYIYVGSISVILVLFGYLLIAGGMFMINKGRKTGLLLLMVPLVLLSCKLAFAYLVRKDFVEIDLLGTREECIAAFSCPDGKRFLVNTETNKKYSDYLIKRYCQYKGVNYRSIEPAACDNLLVLDSVNGSFSMKRYRFPKSTLIYISYYGKKAAVLLEEEDSCSLKEMKIGPIDLMILDGTVRNENSFKLPASKVLVCSESSGEDLKVLSSKTKNIFQTKNGMINIRIYKNKIRIKQWNPEGGKFIELIELTKLTELTELIEKKEG